MASLNKIETFLWFTIFIILSNMCSMINSKSTAQWHDNQGDEGQLSSQFVPFMTGSNSHGKARSPEACLPTNDTCVNFTKCVDGTIKLHENGVAINGYNNYICSNLYEVCCTLDEEKAENQKRIQELVRMRNNNSDDQKTNA